MIKLELYKKKNIIEHCGTIDYYKEVKVGELIFQNELEAISISTQLMQQKLFDKIEQFEF